MKFVQLPNGDLWRGRAADVAVRPDTIDMSGTDSPSDVIAQMISSQRGEQLACVFCGQNFNRRDLNSLYDHVEKQHPSSAHPPTDAEVLAMQAEIANPEIIAVIEAKPIGK